MIKIEKVEKPPEGILRYKYRDITEEIYAREENQWLKISNFANVKEMNNTCAHFHAGARSLDSKLKKLGFKTEHRKDTPNLTLYVRKVRLEEEK